MKRRILAMYTLYNNSTQKQRRSSINNFFGVCYLHQVEQLENYKEKIRRLF